MELTAIQRDALTELINIGFGRAAASLSRLTGCEAIKRLDRANPKCGRNTIILDLNPPSILKNLAENLLDPLPSYPIGSVCVAAISHNLRLNFF